MSSSKHSGRFLIDTSLQNLNEDKRRSGNASLILQEADVKRSEIVPEEWDYLGVLGRQECQSKHWLGFSSSILIPRGLLECVHLFTSKLRSRQDLTHCRKENTRLPIQLSILNNQGKDKTIAINWFFNHHLTARTVYKYNFVWLY